MKPIYLYIIAFALAILVGTTGYFLGRSSKTCPKIDAPILPPENDTIKKLVEKLAILENEYKQLKNKKHEIEVIYLSEFKPYAETNAQKCKMYYDTIDTVYPSIFREWANYYGQ